MSHKHMHVSLGFCEETVPVGTHMCLVYTNPRERTDSMLRFLLSGLVANERTACFSGNMDEDTLREYFAAHAVSYDERKEGNAIALAGTGEVYFKDGVFDPDRMLRQLSDFYADSLKMGFRASRVIGEMVPEVERVPGGERLMEYESRVSMQVKEQPVTAVCLYDANAFDGATILNVLKVHPKMIVNGVVIQNPLFIPPEEFLNAR